MSGIIFFGVLGIWIFVAIKLANLFTSGMQTKSKKKWLYPLILILIFIAPVLDEIIGGFQFAALCKRGNTLIYDAEKVQGKTVLWSGMPREKIKNTLLPIEESYVIWIDLDTKNKLIEYKEYYATGGWLGRFIAFNGVTQPYTFNGTCGVKDRFIRLENELGVIRTYR